MTHDLPSLRAALAATFAPELVRAYGASPGLVLSCLLRAPEPVRMTSNAISRQTGLPEAEVVRALARLRDAGAISYRYSRGKGLEGYHVEFQTQTKPLKQGFTTPEPDLTKPTKTRFTPQTKPQTPEPTKPSKMGFTPEAETPTKPTKSGFTLESKTAPEGFAVPLGGEGGGVLTAKNPPKTKGNQNLAKHSPAEASEPDPSADEPTKTAFRRFTGLWCEAWKTRNGIRYQMDGRDAARIYPLLKTGQTPEQLMAYAEAAWACNCWHCKDAATIFGFERRFRTIAAHLKPAATAAGGGYEQWGAR